MNFWVMSSRAFLINPISLFYVCVLLVHSTFCGSDENEGVKFANKCEGMLRIYKVKIIHCEKPVSFY